MSNVVSVLKISSYRFSNYDEAGGFGKKRLSLCFIFCQVVHEIHSSWWNSEENKSH